MADQERYVDAEPTQRWTRAEFMKAAAAGAAGLGAVGGTADWLVDTGDARAARAPAARPRGVRRFISRPDLRPATVTVRRRRRGTANGLLFLAPSSGPGQRGALIVDDAGDVVWFHPSTPLTTMDFRPGLYKGKPVLTWWEGRHERGVGLRGTYVIADDSYREIARFRSRDQMWPDFHEYMLTRRNTAFVLSYDKVPINLARIGGPARTTAYDGVVRELEIPSGRVLFEWRSLDHVGIEESYQTELAPPYDYFHINSVGFDADGHLLISARNTSAVYKVHRRTGRVIWRLGGKRSDFAMGRGTRFAYQHDARTHLGGRILSLFDNGPVPNTKRQSRAIVLALDTRNMRATLVREIVHAPPLFARATGNAQRLPNRNMLVCWGITGYFSEYDENNRLLLDARLPRGGQNYRVYRFPWTARPSEPPKLVVHASPGSRRALYVSWNGATDVAVWELRTGATRARLEPAGKLPRRGFETRLGIPSRARYAAAVALDRHGKRLGTSNVVRL